MSLKYLQIVLNEPNLQNFLKWYRIVRSMCFCSLVIFYWYSVNNHCSLQQHFTALTETPFRRISLISVWHFLLSSHMRRCLQAKEAARKTCSSVCFHSAGRLHAGVLLLLDLFPLSAEARSGRASSRFSAFRFEMSVPTLSESQHAVRPQALQRA